MRHQEPADALGPHWLGTVFLTLLAAAAAWLLGGPHWGDDLVVLVVFVLLCGAGLRSGVGLLTIFTFVLTFPPFQWPLYWICFAPLTWLWRQPDEATAGWLGEAFGVGFAMCWLSMPFVRADFPQSGILIQAIASLLFGFQIIAIAAAIRWSRDRPVAVSALLAATAATSCDILRVSVLRWPLLAIGSPAAGTPIAQWAYYVSLFGVSFFIYTANFLILPGRASLRELRAWGPPVSAGLLVALAWSGGELIARGVRVEQVPLSALIVQPNRVIGGSVGIASTSGDGPIAFQLDRQTRTALDGGRPVELVIWPECSIRKAVERLGSPEPAETHDRDREPTLDWLFRSLVSDVRIPCLVGAITATRDGLRFNSALLVTPEGEVQRYDKRTLVIGAESMYTRGGPYRCLRLLTSGGRTVRIGVSICYEMHFPWLPQYSAANCPDLMVHLNNESMYRAYRGQPVHGTWACQFRAIETRTWQLVCASWTRSAVIDPRGCVREILQARPGVIRVLPEDGSGRDDPSSHPVPR